MKKDFISLKDYSSAQIVAFIDQAKKLKKNRSLGKDLLKGKTIGLIFQKPSNRTRVSFEVGVNQLGGACIYLGPDEINLGVRETTHDVAKTLSRFVDGIVARTFTHQDILDLAKFASVPVVNGLTDLSHPCQALADLQTIDEHFGKMKGLTMAYIGDGNNVCHSLMIGCAKVGMHLNIACPKGYLPLREVSTLTAGIAKSTGSKISIVNNPKHAVNNVDVIYSDTFVSMGQEAETKKRLKDFKDYQVNAKLTKLASPDYIFMHCLPAHRGQEVTEEIIDGKHSVIFDEAENRLHAQKAVLMYLFKS